MEQRQNWPGERLGLPNTGSGSLAKVGRRLAALCIDWGISYLLAHAFFKDSNAAITITFFVQTWLLTATTGASIGHRALGLRVKTLDGSWIGLWRSAVRVALILLVIPAAIWDADNRGLHDKAAGTVLVRA